jgi:signal peptidase I
MSGAAESTGKSVLREYFEAILVALIFVNFCWIFVVQMFKIPSGSMVDNLLVGDHIVVNKFAYGPAQGRLFEALFPLRSLRRGDIAVFRYPSNPAIDYVKRVIGLPGETLEIRDKVVYVDGKALGEPYVVHVDPLVIPDKPMLSRHVRDQFGPLVIPDGQYFMMGDNRDESSDSRYWGTVSSGLIKGRAFMVYWSYSEPPLPADATIVQRVSEMAGIAVHLLSSTRWDRTFYIVDSRYHYHAERFRETPGE